MQKVNAKKIDLTPIIIAKSEKARSVKDVATYWTLTPYGDDTMTHLRAIKRAVVPEEESEVSKIKKQRANK